MIKDTYTQKLKDPRWQKKRLEIFEIDDFTCQICYDASSTLCVHHLNYEYDKDPWDYLNIDLITLCECCHEREKTDREIENNLIKELKRKFISYRALSDLTNAIRNMTLPHVPGVTATALCDFSQDDEKMKSLIDDLFKKPHDLIEKEKAIIHENASH